MGRLKSDPEWLPILEEHEKVLRFESFSREDALDIGLCIIRLANEKYRGSLAIRIIEDDMDVFAYKMPGTSVENEMWMRRKLNTSRATGVSSLRAFIEIECGLRKETWLKREGAFVACGGCMPVLMQNGETFAYIMVSGLDHELDHQIIADAIAGHLNINIGTIAE